MSSQQQERLFQGEITYQAKLPYLLYLPEGYDEQPGKRWPLVLFLHGAGERGSDLQGVRRNGPPRLIDEGQQFPFIIVSPQCPQRKWWTCEIFALGALLDEIEHTYSVDPDRIYVTGLSMGGMGTWALTFANPDRFAAIVPICGGDDPEMACTIKHIPTWVFHGAKDNVVPLAQSEKMVEALRACGGNVQFTVYPEADHDSWTETYANPSLYTWLLQQRRNTPVVE